MRHESDRRLSPNSSAHAAMTSEKPGPDPLSPDLEVHLGVGDSVVASRDLASVHLSRPLSTAQALLRLGKVDRLADLGASGPLNAATTAIPSQNADPELRKFEAVFGRDALRVSEFVGDFFPRLRRATISSLAGSQGIEHNAASEEEPGKIIHESREPDDPVAHRLTAQHGWAWPYYGAADTTPLFISAAVTMLQADWRAARTEVKQRDGRRRTLLASLRAAVAWLCRTVDADPDGLLTFRRINPQGIANQTWRDSWTRSATRTALSPITGFRWLHSTYKPSPSTRSPTPLPTSGRLTILAIVTTSASTPYWPERAH